LLDRLSAFEVFALFSPPAYTIHPAAQMQPDLKSSSATTKDGGGVAHCEQALPGQE
jgi:hypothetical protein